MLQLLEKVNQFVWGVPALIMILGVGVYLSVCTGFAQVRLFWTALRKFCGQFGKKGNDSGISPYRALCTALGATVGTGNLAGVAGAITLGGPGAVFWMWICALLGMVTKFAEATLAVRYRECDDKGNYFGGPMYMIKLGMRKKWHLLAGVYCFLGVVASFGVGNATQVNALLGGIDEAVKVLDVELPAFARVSIGVILAAFITLLLLGGAKRVGGVAEMLVPIASLGYLLLGMLVLVIRYDRIPGAISSIIMGAFDPRAATGGLLGSAFCALRVGASRGVFTNEAGMGTAAIAHSGAKVVHSVEQGLMGIMEVFIDTILICTMTALVILCSGVQIPYGTDTGVALTIRAFSNVCGQWVTFPIAIALCLFAVATILGWGLYGIRCAQFIFGKGIWKPFVYLQGITVIVGAIAGTGTVWLLSEIVNGLMAIPNLIALAYLSPELVRQTRHYIVQFKQNRT